MRYLVVYAHPVEGSYAAALHRCVIQTLTEAGHEVDDCDLYAEGFQPVLARAERQAYHQVGRNTSHAEKEIERLKRAEGLVFVFPTWWYGLPAILKGYLDRVWLPGVAFEVDNGRTRPLLHNIVRFAVVTTYGSPWWLNFFVVRDPGRHMLMRGIRYLFAPKVRTLYLARYGMDYVDAATRERFLTKVGQRLRDF
jgi:putative NADPH-quinone reductase